jgi:ubiquinone/menaquinone biosynthesis C-methylase UbiE
MDKQKKDIAEGFSKSSDFWKRIYNVDRDDINTLYRLDMLDRKNAVFHLFDKYTCHGPCQILDVGCGPGIFLREAASRGHQVVGVDLSESMISNAKEILDKQNLAMALTVQADIEHLPFRDKSFDAIFCIGVLSYLPGDSNALNEIQRVVRKDGIVIVGLPNQLRLSVLADPYYYMHGISFLKKKRERDRGGEKSPVSVENFRRYLYWRLPRFFDLFNLKMVETIPIGFGPLTLRMKEFISEKYSLKIRRFIEKQAARGLFPVKLISNHWVICLKKSVSRPYHV